MKPKLLHWCVIGWIDDLPQVALCVNVNKLEFYWPEGAPRGYRYNKIDRIDSSSQVLAVLGRVHAPQVPKNLNNQILRRNELLRLDALKF